MKNLNHYVGRIVRLNRESPTTAGRRSTHPGPRPEIHFIVASVSRKMRKLICYGAAGRITVGVAEVVLV